MTPSTKIARYTIYSTEKSVASKLSDFGGFYHVMCNVYDRVKEKYEWHRTVKVTRITVQPSLLSWALDKLFSFATTTTPQRKRTSGTRKDFENVKVSVSKWRRHNEYVVIRQ